MKKLAIIGAGDLGQLIAYHAQTCGFEIAGFFDDYAELGTTVGNFPILGKLSAVEELFANKKFDCLMCGVGYKHMEFRSEIFTQLNKKIPFANIIHPSAYLDPSVELGKGIFILPGCVLDRNVKLGNNILLNTGCTIAHDSAVDDNSFLSPAINVAGFTKIGKNCIIGIGTTIIDNLTIADKIQTGAGSVVTKNLSKPGLYFGVPAKLIKTK